MSAFGYQLDGVQGMLMRQPSDDESSDSESEPEEERWVLFVGQDDVILTS